MKHEKIQRSREGVRVGVFGLGCNLILASAKFFVGFANNSIIIIADAANNLTDSISAIMMILGFQMEAIESEANGIAATLFQKGVVH